MEKKIYIVNIGKLQREVTLIYFDWGIATVARDHTEGRSLDIFKDRKFKKCQTSPTIADCERRALRYWKLSEENLVNNK